MKTPLVPSSPADLTSDEPVAEPITERVGYRSPPQASRFLPGRSGNPRGKAKGTRNLASVIATALGARVIVKENGQRRSISKLEAAIAQLANRAASGDVKATQVLLALAQANEHRLSSSDGKAFGAADELVMAELARRMNSNAEGSNS